MIVAPTDLQLATIQRMCDERGLPMPAPHSKQEASLLIGEILRREYRPKEWNDPHDETDADREAAWLERERYYGG